MLDRTFGYEVVDGKYRVQKTEAKYVRKVYQDILDGISTVKIADWLNEQEVKTRKLNGKWVHRMITRMIRNPIYTGEMGYPKIISKRVQDRAMKELERRSTIRNDLITRNKSNPFYKLIKCDSCNHNLCLYEGEKVLYWRCQKTIQKYGSACGRYRSEDGISDDEMKQTVLSVINELIANPQHIKNVGTITYNQLSIIKIDNQIKNLLKEEADNFEQIDELLKQKHSLIYGQYKTDYRAETLMLQKRVSKLQKMDQLNREVLTRLVREIRIDSVGVVKLILWNHQIIEKRISVIRGIKNG